MALRARRATWPPRALARAQNPLIATYCTANRVSDRSTRRAAAPRPERAGSWQVRPGCPASRCPRVRAARKALPEERSTRKKPTSPACRARRRSRAERRGAHLPTQSARHLQVRARPACIGTRAAALGAVAATRRTPVSVSPRTRSCGLYCPALCASSVSVTRRRSGRCARTSATRPTLSPVGGCVRLRVVLGTARVWWHVGNGTQSQRDLREGHGVICAEIRECVFLCGALG